MCVSPVEKRSEDERRCTCLWWDRNLTVYSHRTLFLFSYQVFAISCLFSLVYRQDDEYFSSSVIIKTDIVLLNLLLSFIQDTQVVFVKTSLIYVRIIHAKTKEPVFVLLTIRISVVFVQAIIPVERVMSLSKISVHHHHVSRMQHVKIYLMDIDVLVRRIKHVIEQR